MIEIDRLVPFREALASVGMKTTKGYQQVRDGKLSVVRNGRRTFVRQSEIRRYINELAAQTASKIDA